MSVANKEVPAMAQMQSAKPARKVWVALLPAAVTTIVVWALSLGKIIVPGAVAVAISSVLSFIVSYLVPPADADGVVPS